MNDNSPIHQTSEELAWQADRLLLDALTPAEQAEFAELLAADQSAREVLADEVLLLQSLAQLTAADFASSDLVTPAAATRVQPTAARSYRWTWLATSIVAAGLLLTATLASQRNLFDTVGPTDRFVDRSGQLEQVAELASLWSQNRSADDSLSGDSTNSDSLTETEWEPRPRVERDSDDAMAPAWMFAALAAEQAKSDATSSEEDIQWQ